MLCITITIYHLNESFLKKKKIPKNLNSFALTTIFILINLTTNLSINRLIEMINLPQKINNFTLLIFYEIKISMISFFKSKS